MESNKYYLVMCNRYKQGHYHEEIYIDNLFKNRRDAIPYIREKLKRENFTIYWHNPKDIVEDEDYLDISNDGIVFVKNRGRIDTPDNISLRIKELGVV